MFEHEALGIELLLEKVDVEAGFATPNTPSPKSDRIGVPEGIVTLLLACGPAGGSVAKGMKKISYRGYRFPPEIIQQAIWLYLRFTLSLRDVEDLLAERGIMVSYETVRRWVNHYGAYFKLDQYPVIRALMREVLRGVDRGVLVSRDIASPNSSAGEPVDLKERMDQVVKANIQVFEKAQAYSNALTLGGYAGIFAVGTFSRGVLAPRTMNAVIVLVGVSLILYVSWEIFGMIQRAAGQARFLALVDKSPTDFFQIFGQQEAENRRIARRNLIAWKVILVPTIITGYAAALLLAYNVAASIFGFTQWP